MIEIGHLDEVIEIEEVEVEVEKEKDLDQDLHKDHHLKREK